MQYNINCDAVQLIKLNINSDPVEYELWCSNINNDIVDN